MKKKSYLTLLFISVLILSAKSVAALQVESRTFEEAPPPPGSSLEGFGSLLPLNEAISRATQTSAQVKEAIERLEKEKALYRAKRAEFFPRIKTEIFEAVSTGEKRLLSYFDTGIEQPLFQGGRALALKRKQKTIVEKEGLRLEEAKLDLELTLRILYAQALAQKELTRIAQGEVKELTRAYARVKSLVEKEALTQYELFRIESLLQKAKQGLVEHKETFDYLLSVLKETVSLVEGESLELEPLGEIQELSGDISQYLERTRKQDPLYRITELRVKEKGFEKKALQAEWFPQISLATRWNLNRDVFVDTDRVMVGILGKWNIWDFGRTSSEVKAKTHEMEEEKWAGQAEIQEKENEVRELFHKARAAKEKIRLTETLQREREEAYKNDKARLIAEEKGEAELLDSFLALEEARMARIEAITDYRILVSRLERHAGFDHELLPAGEKS